MAEYDIFRDQLAIKYPSYGHALWVPTPRNPDRPVQVGDVGFIRRGKFHRLFNSLLSADDPSHDELGVPEYHEPLVPNMLNHIDKGSLSSNNYCSVGVSVEADPGYHSSSPDDFRQVSFKYQRTRGAAVLSLPVTAQREDTLAQGDFGQWMVRHIDSWLAFAKKLGLGIEQMEEIILVTGCDRTRSWTNIAFLGGQIDAQVSFGVNVEGPDTTGSINFQLSPEFVRGAVISQGPEGTALPENQCVFIRGFRVARSFWKLPKRLKAAAGTSPDSGYGRDPDIEVISIPEITKYHDPLHVLLDCIAEEASDCEIVLAHDDDLAMLNGLGHNTALETLEPEVIMDLFRRANIEIHKFIRFYAKDLAPIGGSSNDMSLVKVATLPMTAENWRRSLVLTSRGDTSKGETSLPADHGDSVPSTPRDLAASTFHVNQMTALASAPSNEKVKIGTERRADRALEPNKGDELFIRDRNWTFKDLKLDKLEKDLWGDYGRITPRHPPPRTLADITALCLSFLSGEIASYPLSTDPLSTEPLSSESQLILPHLLRLAGHSWWPVGWQSAVDDLPSEDATFGWGPPGGYVYQKPFVEFFASAAIVERLERAIETMDGVVDFLAGNNVGELKTSMQDTEWNTLTWGVFPNREIIQPNIIERESFLTWKDEAFSIWTDWAWQSPPDSQERQLLEGIRDTRWLVNVMHHDFKDREALWSFLFDDVGLDDASLT